MAVIVGDIVGDTAPVRALGPGCLTQGVAGDGHCAGRIVAVLKNPARKILHLGNARLSQLFFPLGYLDKMV